MNGSACWIDRLTPSYPFLRLERSLISWHSFHRPQHPSLALLFDSFTVPTRPQGRPAEGAGRLRTSRAWRQDLAAVRSTTSVFLPARGSWRLTGIGWVVWTALELSDGALTASPPPNRQAIS